MADVLDYQQPREFQGDETISILPPAGGVRLPNRKIVVAPEDLPAGVEPPKQGKGLAMKSGGLQARSSGLQMSSNGRLRFGGSRRF